MRKVAIAAVALAVVLGATACSSSTPAARPSATTDSLSGSITVFGAASLTTTFTALATDFEKLHPKVTVATSFAGSADLVTQIAAGAPADVFASADTKNMDKLTGASLIEGRPVNFATNVLEIAVPPSNPAKITGFADLAKPGVKTVICAPVVPCGAATVAIEKATGVTLTPVSEETAVTDVLGKVSSGEADAGLVYVTDVRGAGSAVKGLPFADSATAVNTYPIGALRASTAPAVARAFIDFVTGRVGQKVLAEAGFGKP